MTRDRKEFIPSEMSQRILSGVGGGVENLAKSSVGNLGLLALAPLIRRGREAPSGLPAYLRTTTEDDIARLAYRMSLAGGRDPAVGRELRLKVHDDPGKASFLMERKPKGRSPRDWIHVSKNIAPETLAHEVGHATSSGKSGRLLRALSSLAQKPAAKYLPSLLALSGVLGPRDEIEPHLVAKTAPLLGGAQLAAILGEETRANLRGIKIIKKIQGQMALKNKLKMFIPTASYLGKTGLLVGVPLGILSGIAAYNKAKQEEKPVTLKGLLRNTPTQLASIPPYPAVQKHWTTRLGK